MLLIEDKRNFSFKNITSNILKYLFEHNFEVQYLYRTLFGTTEKKYRFNILMYTFQEYAILILKCENSKPVYLWLESDELVFVDSIRWDVFGPSGGVLPWSESFEESLLLLSCRNKISF